MSSVPAEGEPTPAPDRPLYLQPSLIGVVIVGGTLGTAAREVVSLTIGTVGSFPLAIFLINVLGAGALGILLERLAHDGPGSTRRQRARLFAGTGFLGGFTTYSALVTDTDLLFRAGDVSTGILYAVGSLVLGLLAAWGGIVLGGSLRRRVSPADDA